MHFGVLLSTRCLAVAAFEYIATDAAGKRHTGVISADSPRDARRALRLRALMALDVNPLRARRQLKRRRAGFRHKVRSKQRVLLVRQLAVLLQSGLQVEQALGAAARSASVPAVQRALHSVKAEIADGARLAEAMTMAPEMFPPLVRSVTSAGEMSGQLGEIMERLASYLERSHSLQQKVRSALVYPALLGFMAFGMVGALMIFIVPKLVEQFDVFGAQLPWITRAIIAVSDAMRSHGLWVVMALAVGLWALSAAPAVPGWKMWRDKTILRLPIVGEYARTICAARFARVFATLAGSGATVMDALAAARSATGNLVFERATDQIAERVREGGALSVAMRASGIFPEMMMHMVVSGEAGRDVPGMMTRAADFLDAEFETGSATLLSLLEPLIIVILGGVVGLVVLSIMLAILQLNTLALG